MNRLLIAAKRALTEAESDICSEYRGTSIFEGHFASLNYLRKAISIAEKEESRVTALEEALQDFAGLGVPEDVNPEEEPAGGFYAGMFPSDYIRAARRALEK